MEQADAERVEAQRLTAWQHIGYAYFLLGAVGKYASMPARNSAEIDAWDLGNKGIRPDADALAAARAEGYAAGRESVLKLVRDARDEVRFASDTTSAVVCARLMDILAECNAATGTGEGQ
jgi:hypothetical protein